MLLYVNSIRHFHMSHNPFRVGGQPVEEMYGIMTKISSVSSQNQLLMLKNAPEFTKIMIGEICTSLQLNVEKFFFCPYIVL